MKKYSLLFLFTFVFQGCSSLAFHEEHYASRYSQFGYGYKPQASDHTDTINERSSAKIIKKYADRISFNLRDQINIETIPSVAITSFVDLDDNLKQTHALGNKLAEALIISFKKAGFNVVELNMSEDIKINDSGSFAFKRHLNKKIPTPFIVSGIINYDQAGVTINTRLMQISDAAIVAAHSLFMPYSIVKSTFPHVDGTDLIIKGD
jgi:TolB-like protein|tara:strand:- start:873 stop:1493 length:621 start_codon:yes stop_codon:yes gene_type:complete